MHKSTRGSGKKLNTNPIYNVKVLCLIGKRKTIKQMYLLRPYASISCHPPTLHRRVSGSHDKDGALAGPKLLPAPRKRKE